MSKSTILIVEDDAPTCALWTRHLEHWGWNVEAVSSAEEAELLIDQNQPQAVVLDIMLADEKSGWDLLAKLRSENLTSGLPVFVVSAVDEPRPGFREGATDFLLKPCSANTLAAKIAEQLVLADTEEAGNIQ